MLIMYNINYIMEYYLVQLILVKLLKINDMNSDQKKFIFIFLGFMIILIMVQETLDQLLQHLQVVINKGQLKY